MTQIDLHQFGLYQGVHFDERLFQSPVTVFYGPNEAGKSTVHSFLKGVLFGFQVKNNEMEGLPGAGRWGGKLQLTDHNGHKLTVERLQPPLRGRVTVHTEHESTQDESVLSKLLGHVTPSVYGHIFAFGHAELQYLHTLQGDEISAFLYRSALGTGSVNFIKTEQELRTIQNKLFKPRGSNPEINVLLKQIEEQEQLLLRLQHKVEAYTFLKQEKLEVLRQIDALRHERDRLEKEELLLETIIAGCQTIYRKEEEAVKVKEELEATRQEWNRLMTMTGQRWTREQLQSLDVSLPVREQLLYMTEQSRMMTSQLTAHVVQQEELEVQQRRLETDLKQTEAHGGGIHTQTAGEHSLLNDRALKSGRRQQDLPDDLVQENRSLLSQDQIFMYAGVLLTVLLPLVLFWAEQQAIGLVAFVILGLLTGLIWKKGKADKLKYARLSEQLEAESLRQHKALQERQERLRAELDIVQHKTTQSSLKWKEMQRERQALQQELEERLAVLNIPAQFSESGLSQMLQYVAEAKNNVVTEQKLLFSLKNVEDRLSAEKERLGEWCTELRHLWSDIPQQDQEELLERACQQRLQHGHTNLNTNRQEIEALLSRKGQLEAQLEELEREEQLQFEWQKLEEMKQRLQRLVQEWSVHKLAEQLCTSIRTMYEEERQPAVLSRAGHYLSQVTAGKYTQVIAPLDRQELIVVQQNGSRLRSSQLSRGTAEQVYLCMRLALVEEYGKHVRLPVVMDDPLVHFDAARLDGALLGIKQLSATHQIIMFTCHQYMVEHIREIIPEARFVEMERIMERSMSTDAHE